MAERRSVLHRALLSLLLLLLAAVVAFRPPLEAQELDARRYSNAPTGLNFLALAYSRSSGNILLDASVPVVDLEADLELAVLRYTRTIGLLGRSGKVKVILPFASGDFRGVQAGGAGRRRDISGLGDAKVSLEVNLVGAPALSPREFAAYRQRTIVGASATLTAPTGQYDASKLVNLGTNRWTLQTEIGLSRAAGKWTLETAGTAWFFNDNDDFFGGTTFEQDPLYAVQAHVIYTIRKGLWAAASAGYADGGATTVAGKDRDDIQQNTRAGVRLVYPVTRRQGLLIDFSTGIATTFGTEANIFSVAYQYMWGGE